MKRTRSKREEGSRTVFISGASRGIGAAIALNLAEAGYDIWLNYRSSEQKAREVASQIKAMGRSCRLLRFDVTDENHVAEILEPLLDETAVYGFVHNAGITRDNIMPLMRREEWDQVIDVHLNSFFLLGKLFAKHMVSARHGRIVAIGSVSGETGQAGQANYAAAKAGLVGGIKALARELARRNVLANVVSPGLIETEMIQDLPLDRILPMIPMGRVGSAREVAGVVRFLLSEDASYITGQVISVNGGMYM